MIRCFFLVLALGFPVVSTLAQVLLYEDDVVRTQHARYDEKKALEHVFVKLSGNSALKQNKKFVAALQYAEEWVQDYHYYNDPVKNKPMVHYRFDSDSILKTLEKLGVHPWLLEREKTLLILLLDHDGQTSLVTSESTLPFVHHLQAQLHQRGLPFHWVSKDDHTTINVDMLWQGNLASVEKTAVSFGANQIALVKLVFQPDTGSWQAQLLVENRLGKTSSLYEYVNVGEVLEALANGLLEKTYSLSKIMDAVDDESSVTIKLIGVNSQEQWHDLEKKVKSLRKVKAFQLQSLREHAIYFKCELIGGAEKFMRELMVKPWFDFKATVQTPHKKPVWVLQVREGNNKSV